MKFQILVLCLFIGAEVLGLRNEYRGNNYRGSSPTCGKRQVHRSGHHLGGPRVGPGYFPWNAALLKNGNYFCGGALISSTEVVTAAHCIQPKKSEIQLQPQNISVILGHYDLSKLNERGRITVAVKNVRLHPDWNPVIDSYDADIAILKLEQEVLFTNFIQPICLIEPESDEASLNEGMVVGFESTDNGQIANTPRILDTPITSYHNCSKDHSFDNLLSHRTFCGGKADGTGVCIGDGGSGLIVFKNGIYYLRGIVSASLINNVNTCNFNAYSIFADAVEYYMWLRNNDRVNIQSLIDEKRRLEQRSNEIRSQGQN